MRGCMEPCGVRRLSSPARRLSGSTHLLHEPKDNSAEPGRPDPEASARRGAAQLCQRLRAGHPPRRGRPRGFGYRDADGASRRRPQDAGADQGARHPAGLDRRVDLARPPTATSRRPAATSAAASSTAITSAGRPRATRPNIRAWSPLPKRCRNCASASPRICSRRDLSRDSVLASVIWLLDNTMIRVGNATYARDNKSFGLTTLRQRHVEIVGSRVRFAFKGKSGKQWKLDLVDRRIVRIGAASAGTARPAAVPVSRRKRRAALGQLAGRQRLSARSDGRRFHVEAFSHLGRHHGGALAVCRHSRAPEAAARRPG